MYCPQCGVPNDNNAFRCVKCSEVIQVVPVRTALPQIEDTAGMRMLLPVGRSLWAIAAGYAGLFAVLFVTAPLALLLGVAAVVDIRRHPEKHGLGRAVFAIVMGVLFSAPLVFFIIAGVLGK
ncbi:MAG: DUF4190 domain-containing protein [Phycisphaerae bacterium]|nr:DUF4190 domain-containing protein [Phycisphaerae bacterium]